MKNSKSMPLKLLPLCLALLAGLTLLNIVAEKNIKKSGRGQDATGDARPNSDGPSHDSSLEEPSQAHDQGTLVIQHGASPPPKIGLVAAKITPFPPSAGNPSGDSKYWNLSHDRYLVVDSVWYHVHDRDGHKVVRLPRFINVDAGADPAIADKSGGDIQWRWIGKTSVIGVQQIIRKTAASPATGLDREFPEIRPEAVRIYLYDIESENPVREVIPPDVPEGMVVRIEDLSADGYLSMAALSPEAYNSGDDMKVDAGKYRYLGTYKIDQ